MKKLFSLSIGIIDSYKQKEKNCELFNDYYCLKPQI